MAGGLGRIPKSNIGPWAREIIDECLITRDNRRSEYAYYKNLFYTGSEDQNASKDNCCYSHIDKLSSYLFSPAYLRFSLEFEADETMEWMEINDIATRHFNREFHRRRMGLAFAQANDVALIKGCSILKVTWGHSGLHPNIIQPDFFGVLREDIEDLDEQDAFVHSYFLTEAQFMRMMYPNPRAKELLTKVQDTQPSANPELEDNYIHQLVMGGIQPVSIGAPTGNKGSVNYLAYPPGPRLAASVASKLIKVDDLWFMNTEANGGDGDWNCVRMVGDIVLEGYYQLQNLSGIKGSHPFTKVCANEVPGYFWGRSELATIAPTQILINARMNDADTIYRLQAKPPRAFTGFSNITDEKARALLTAGGTLTDSSAMNGKVQSLAPEMPANLLEYINMLKQNIETQGGFTPITSGQGDVGVRAGAHAQTLLKTAAPRLLDRALILEGQCSSYADTCFDFIQAKDPRIFKTPKGAQFTFAQLPKDISISIDTHTSSPAFSGDAMNLAFALAARGAIDGESLIKLTHPPYEEDLVLKYRERQAQQAKMLQEHPELLTKGKGGRK
jgi:hypothetical protein